MQAPKVDAAIRDLIAAGLAIRDLIAAGLIDKTQTGLTPHNWHARQYHSDVSTARVKKFRSKQSETFQKRSMKREAPISVTSPDGFDVEAGFRKLWAAYPSKGRTQRTVAQQYFIEEIKDQATFGAALESVTIGKWAKSEKWRKGFVLAFSQWLHNRCWEEDPEPAEAEPEEHRYPFWSRPTRDPEVSAA